MREAFWTGFILTGMIHGLGQCSLNPLNKLVIDWKFETSFEINDKLRF